MAKGKNKRKKASKRGRSAEAKKHGKKHHGVKGQVPLEILERRLVELNDTVCHRGGECFPASELGT